MSIFFLERTGPVPVFFVGAKGGFPFVENKSLGSKRYLSFSLLSKILMLSSYSFSFYSFHLLNGFMYLINEKSTYPF